MEFGQTPKQLFPSPHPKRQVPASRVGLTQGDLSSKDHLKEGGMIGTYLLLPQKYFPSRPLQKISIF